MYVNACLGKVSGQCPRQKKLELVRNKRGQVCLEGRDPGQRTAPGEGRDGGWEGWTHPWRCRGRAGALVEMQ